MKDLSYGVSIVATEDMLKTTKNGLKLTRKDTAPMVADMLVFKLKNDRVYTISLYRLMGL